LSTTEHFLELVQEDIQKVEALMQRQADGYNPDVGAALRHLLSSGGKRMRPAVTILIGRMLGGDPERLITLSAAIELLHTATLVHDDLIDGSLLRRGIATLNARWSPGATVLTGDFLFARAAKLAAETNSIPVMNVFSHTLTVIVDGEISQMFAHRCQVNREDYEKRIYAKTASLFETCARASALISPVDETVLNAISIYGYNIGMAFQIVDDILDFTGEQTKLGKPIGSDLRQGLVTLPTMLFVAEHPDDPGAVELLQGHCITDNSEIIRMVEAIRASGSILTAQREAEAYIQKAIDIMETMPKGVENQALVQIARYIVERNS